MQDMFQGKAWWSRLWHLGCCFIAGVVAVAEPMGDAATLLVCQLHQAVVNTEPAYTPPNLWTLLHCIPSPSGLQARYCFILL